MALSSRMQAFRVDTYAPRGLDDSRTQRGVSYGHWVADASTSFASGMLVALASDGEVIKSTGAGRVLGVAAAHHCTSFYAPVVDEYIQLNGTTATNLAHASLRTGPGGAAGIRVSTAVSGGGTTYTETTHYTVSYTNGTVTRVVVGGGIGDGDWVYVTYSYAVTTTELARDGGNFWLTSDSTSMQANKITVIETGKIFTPHFDPHQVYAINDELEAGTTANSLEGLFTKHSTGDTVVGRVIQVPTATDPFLGVELYCPAKIS